MSYTKAELISQVLNRVQNQPNMDNAVNRAHIAKFIAPAINYVISKQYYINLQDSGKEISSFFLGTHYLPVLRDDKTKDYYATLATQLIDLPNNRGLVYVGGASGEENEYIPIPQKRQSLVKHYKKFLIETTYRLDGKQIVFVDNFSPTVKEVKVKYISSVEGLKEDDIIPIPAELEYPVIQLMLEFFLGKRQLPQDTRNDNNDTIK